MPITHTSITANMRTIWLQLLAMAFGMTIMFWFTGLSIDFHSNPVLMTLIAGYSTITAFYYFIRRDMYIAHAMTLVGQLFLTLLLGLMLTYAACVTPFPYKDASLLAIDEALGFSRSFLVSILRANDFIEMVLDAAYLSIQPQILIVPLALLITAQLQRLQVFTLAFGIALVLTASVAVFVPALSAGVYVDLAPNGIASLPPGTYSHVPTLEALRSGEMTVINLSNLEGLITFPSFHTANAILFAWAVWETKYLRWAGVILNGLMIASAVTAGAHYVIDIMAGTGVAAASIAMAITLSQEATLIEANRLRRAAKRAQRA